MLRLLCSHSSRGYELLAPNIAKTTLPRHDRVEAYTSRSFAGQQPVPITITRFAPTIRPALGKDPAGHPKIVCAASSRSDTITPYVPTKTAAIVAQTEGFADYQRRCPRASKRLQFKEPTLYILPAWEKNNTMPIALCAEKQPSTSPSIRTRKTVPH